MSGSEAASARWVSWGHRASASTVSTLSAVTKRRLSRTTGSISARSRRFSLGMSTVLMPFRLAAMVFSFRPPMASTRPRRVTSPVMATSDRTRRPVRAEVTAVVMATPAEGPSLGTAPSGKWMWMSRFL